MGSGELSCLELYLDLTVPSASDLRGGKAVFPAREATSEYSMLIR